MYPYIISRLQRDSERLRVITTKLTQEDCMQDMEVYKLLSKEHRELRQIVELWDRYQNAQHELKAVEEMLLHENLENDLIQMYQEEIFSLHHDLTELTQKIYVQLIVADPDDERPAFIEIRAGTGGDESTLFAADLMRMYTRYAERQSWKTEIISLSQSEMGGYKEVVLKLSGDKVYGRMRLESGGHRVQRVPITEAQGRIHTSACTVAVMPEPDPEVAIEINPADLRIDTFRASGAGGQHINKTDSAVRITHLPTGVVAECQDDRSQHRNRANAMQVLLARIKEKERSAKQAHLSATRKSLIGTGDRNDRIRTYNFPQGRMTDHRINLTLYKLAFIMDGDLDETLDALVLARQSEQIADLNPEDL